VSAINDVTGWGLLTLNLALALAREGVVEPLALRRTGDLALTPDEAHLLVPALEAGRKAVADARRAAHEGPIRLGFPVLHDLYNDFTSGSLGRVLGTRDHGLIFFESARFSTAGLEAARRLGVVVAGSSWNADVLRAHGVERVVRIIQGIDPERFHPLPGPGRRDGRFVVFSGGKLEFRKGQDLVLAAFRIFHQRHPDALLVTAWHNAHTAAAATLHAAGHVASGPSIGPDGRLAIAPWFEQSGLPTGAAIDVGVVSNRAVPDLL
jgi:glycosyltransferase involved in cell wall biosynthesis